MENIDSVTLVRVNTQQDCMAYKHQLSKSQQHLDQNDLDFRTRIVHIEGQLQRAQDTLDGKNSAIQRLEDLLEEAGQRKKAAEDENRALLEDVGRKEHQIHVSEEPLSIKSSIHPSSSLLNLLINRKISSTYMHTSYIRAYTDPGTSCLEALVSSIHLQRSVGYSIFVKHHLLLIYFC